MNTSNAHIPRIESFRVQNYRVLHDIELKGLMPLTVFLDPNGAIPRCAYWQSLRGAPATTNGSGVTVKLPKSQMFTPQALIGIAERLSRREFPTYPAA